MSPCPECGEELETPLACSACGVLIPVGDPPPGPFELFALEPAFGIDTADLRKRLVRTSRLVHPDFFGGTPNEAHAERGSALLNEAHAVLSDDARRAEYLLTSLGGPDEKAERAMPQAFLMEVLEWNELLEEAREPGADPSDPKLAALGQELESQRSATLEAIAKLLTPLPEAGSDTLVQVRQQLNALRYLARALAQLADLRLDQAEQR